MGAVNLEKCFAQFTDTFSPKIAGELNEQYILLVKLEGDKVPWHAHENEDEMFMVIEGAIDIHERDKLTTVKAGEFYIMPRRVEHRVIPQGHAKIILFEPKNTAHTGNVESEITRESYDRLEIK